MSIQKITGQPLKVAVGEDYFDKLVTKYDVFADKTLFIKDIIDSSEKAILITYPRRWGKSLNLDTLKVFFEIAKNIYKIRSKNKKDLLKLNKCIVIQTWLSDSTFKGRKFKDLYMPGIEKNLSTSDQKIIYLFCLTSINNLKKIINKLKASNLNYIFLEQFLSLKDLIVLFKIAFKLRSRYKQNIFKNTFGQVFSIYWFDGKLEISWLVNLFISKIEKNLNAEFILTNENHKFQYIFQYFVKHHHHKINCYGYFHTSFPNNHLSLKPLKYKNTMVTPIPDKLLVNSDVYGNHLKKYYLKGFKIINTIAYKQNYLLGSKLKNPHRNKVSLLIILPGNILLGTGLINTLKYINKNY